MATQTNMQYKCWKKYFTRLNRHSVKCNICNADNIVICCSRKYAPVHLYRTHNIIDEKVILQWNNDNYFIWQYFSKEDKFTAKCKFCSKLLLGAYEKSCLETHLKLIHLQEIQEEIKRTWVSAHFTFDLDNCDISCIHCTYCVKIYDGVDVLKNHLKDEHDLDENVVHLIKNELDYLEATMQCTTEESNVVTSFQDGNTHS